MYYCAQGLYFLTYLFSDFRIALKFSSLKSELYELPLFYFDASNYV